MTPYADSTTTSFQSEHLLHGTEWQEDGENDISISPSPPKGFSSSITSKWIWFLQKLGVRQVQRNVFGSSRDPENTKSTARYSNSSGPAYCLCHRSRRVRLLIILTLGVFTMLGVIQAVSLLYGVLVSFSPNYLDQATDHWNEPGGPGENLRHWPTDSTADIRPVACHSHNDYWRSVPLFSALKAGCISVEADIWLYDDDLYVGHTKSSLANNRTLTRLYIDPIVALLEKQNPITRFKPSRNIISNGIFDTNPFQTFGLLIDFKTSGPEIWPYLISQLSPLRERGYLTHFNGSMVIKRPITVIATGRAPFDLIVANSTYRDVFFDAPLTKLTAASKSTSDSIKYDPTNSYYASASFQKAVGFPWTMQMSTKQRRRLRAQIKGAHDSGLKVRYWDTPIWPRSLRNRIWMDLIQEGVDLLNVDDLKSATRKDWTRS